MDFQTAAMADAIGSGLNSTTLQLCNNLYWTKIILHTLDQGQDKSIIFSDITFKDMQDE